MATDNIAQEILAFLKKDPESNEVEIRDAVYGRNSTISVVLEQLVYDGLVIQSEAEQGFTYSVPAEPSKDATVRAYFNAIQTLLAELEAEIGVNDL